MRCMINNKYTTGRGMYGAVEAGGGDGKVTLSVFMLSILVPHLSV